MTVEFDPLDDDGTMGPVFRRMTAMKKERHAEWKTANMAVFDGQKEFPFTVTNNGESVLFRVAGKPKSDFFPSTGRWRVAGKTKTYRGGALAFLNWYRMVMVVQPKE